MASMKVYMLQKNYIFFYIFYKMLLRGKAMIKIKSKYGFGEQCNTELGIPLNVDIAYKVYLPSYIRMSNHMIKTLLIKVVKINLQDVTCCVVFRI